MGIVVDKERKIFCLNSPNTSYAFGILDERLPIHIYYGSKINEIPAIEDVLSMDRCFSQPANTDGDRMIFDEALPQEYPLYGSCDLRTPAFHAIYEDGSRVTQWRYSGYKVYSGKEKLLGLPCTYVENESEADSLEVEFIDNKTGLVVVLKYTVFSCFDAITRSTCFKNSGKETINIQSAQSICVDFMSKDFKVSYLAGTYATETHIHTIDLDNGNFSIDSKRGISSHQFNPFIMITDKTANENHGDVYGFSLVYSGNFQASANVDGQDMTRILMGINSFDFSWQLKSNEEFQTPEVVLVYSANGIGNMSRIYHKLYRNRLCRGKYKNARRPVLINNWEATYFDFDDEKILNIAKSAKELGIELFVLDDGWFGRRNDDRTSLGDWFENKEKLPKGISGLADSVEKLGMKFGLWFEPEAISPLSLLYENHPDWCIKVDGRSMSKSRNQYLLDLSRDDVCEYIYSTLSYHLSNAKICYIKWDMNRPLTEVGSSYLSSKQQGEVSHRYVLGLYKILERLTTEFPNVLIEGCSSGGGRFDPGMLYYCPQIWASDCSDAAERMKIQHGLSLVYPFSSISAHVSDVPNHQTGRSVSMKTRGNTAMPGQFGYELDITKLNSETLEIIKVQVERYKELWHVFHEGDLYRLKSPYNSNYTCWEFVTEDKNIVALYICRMYSKMFFPHQLIKLRGIDAFAKYKEEKTQKIFAGCVLMEIGFNPSIYLEGREEYNSEIFVFKKISNEVYGQENKK